MVDKKFIYTRDYPRAPFGDAQDSEGVVGLPEIAAITGHTEAAVYKWFEQRKLPPWDGPRVWGKATWKRATVLAWAHRWNFTTDRRGVACGEHEEAARWAEMVPEQYTVKASDLT